MDFLALKGMIRRVHPDAGDILPHMPSNSHDPSDKHEAITNLMAYLHPEFQMSFSEAVDPYGGSMISPYDDEPSDEEMDKAYDEAEYYIQTEHPINGDDQNEISNLKRDTEIYLDQIGLGDMVSAESLDQIIKNTYPATELASLKMDMAKDPITKAQFSNEPKNVIDRYQKRDI